MPYISDLEMVLRHMNAHRQRELDVEAARNGLKLETSDLKEHIVRHNSAFRAFLETRVRGDKWEEIVFDLALHEDPAKVRHLTAGLHRT